MRYGSNARPYPMNARSPCIQGSCYRALAPILVAFALWVYASAAVSASVGTYTEKGADTCLDCHEDSAVTGIFRTAHGRPTDAHAPFGHGQLQCEACHGPGDAHANGTGKSRPSVIRFGKKSQTSKEVQNEQCLTCHAKNAAHWGANAHAGNQVACGDCHTLHQPKDPVRDFRTQTLVCTSCHQARGADALKPSHHPLLEGKMGCSSCHAPHGSTAPSALKANTVTELCTTCHAENRGPFLWEHEPVAEDCSNCHDAHGATQPSLLKSRPPFLCQQCHDVQGHPSVSYGPDGLSGSGGVQRGVFLQAGSCLNCHSKVHGSNHPSGSKLMR